MGFSEQWNWQVALEVLIRLLMAFSDEHAILAYSLCLVKLNEEQ